MRCRGDEQGYVNFVIEVKARIRQGQLRALQSVNKELLALYWDLGEAIHRKQEENGLGQGCGGNPGPRSAG
jgi:hypothetical protein